MFGSTFVRGSGIAAILAGIVILLLFAVTMLADNLDGSGWEAVVLTLPVLWGIGLGGLAMVGGVGRLGKGGLAFGGLACVVMLIGLSQLFRIDDGMGWGMMIIGMIGVPVGLIFYGLDGLKQKPLTRWNGLPLAIGVLAGPVTITMEWVDELTHSSWQQQADYGFILWAVIMGMGWIGLGYLLWSSQDMQMREVGAAA